MDSPRSGNEEGKNKCLKFPLHFLEKHQHELCEIYYSFKKIITAISDQLKIILLWVGVVQLNNCAESVSAVLCQTGQCMMAPVPH